MHVAGVSADLKQSEIWPGVVFPPRGEGNFAVCR
jgi:hypothetical protein